MNFFEYWIDTLNNWVWGPPLIILLAASGLYLTVRTRGLQFRYFYYAHKLAFTRHDDRAQGDISHFQALMTAMAATIGIGSITGVATAVAAGGLGSLFWMWMAALLGMATKYAEAILAIKYRSTDVKGEMCGGPMYYIEKGLKMKWLAILFAIFGMVASFGIGNTVQAHSVADAMLNLTSLHPFWSGLALMILIGIALMGGIKSIGKVAGVLVPAMALFYLVGALIVIILKIEAVPAAFALIFHSAFHGEAAVGGFAGATVMMAVQLGVSRGVFSSEAGLGSSPIAAAAAKTDTPGRQSLVSMCSVFLTTGVVCTLTGLVIAVSGVLGKVGPDGRVLDGSAMALYAFDQILPYGGLIVTIALIPFAYSTILGWAFYGEKCSEYLFGLRSIKIYRTFFIFLLIPGSVLSLKVVWGFANMMNGLMAFPNLIALFGLAGIVAKETAFFDKLVKKERQDKSLKKHLSSS
jgi:AGCS family alanine or glycine:cation symporter